MVCTSVRSDHLGAGLVERHDGLAQQVVPAKVAGSGMACQTLGLGQFRDRIRMQDHAGDSGVYVRSMATRGHLGGLARAARQAVNLMSMSGFDYIVVETVGVGQSEVEVMDLVDIVILVLAPGWGDQIQADKAGIVEIADVFVINKSDRPGVEPLRRALTEIAHTAGKDRPILVTNALTGEGVDKLLEPTRR